MRIYQFTSDEKKMALRSDGVSIRWGNDGPAGGGQIWREWEEDGRPTPADYAAPPPTSAQVNAERDRRIASGVPYGGHVYDFDAVSKDNIIGAATLAKFAMIAGAGAGNYRWANPDADFTWIVQSNEKVPLDAPTMSALGDIAASWTTRHFYAARAIKDMDPIPADFTDDKYWP